MTRERKAEIQKGKECEGRKRQKQLTTISITSQTRTEEEDSKTVKSNQKSNGGGRQEAS